METRTRSSPTTSARWRTRLKLSIPATAAGWLAATLVTLPFEWVEIWRNAAPSALASPMLEGTSLWSVFTLGVCAATWCVIILPLALLAPAELVLRRRRMLLVACPLLAVLVIGWRLQVWRDLVDEHGPENPLFHLLLWEYWLFGMALALGTTLVYTRLLRGRLSL